MKSNGFFIQEPDATVDADPVTSEGIFVFTSGAPPAAAAVGNLVQVTGTISEFVPSQDPLQPPLTELTSPTVVLVVERQPAAGRDPAHRNVPRPGRRLRPARAPRGDARERGVAHRDAARRSATSPSPTQLRPRRECSSVSSPGSPGRSARRASSRPTPVPTARFRRSRAGTATPSCFVSTATGSSAAQLIDVGTGAVVTGLVGPLDYSFRRYTILPEPTSTPVVSGGPTLIAAPVPTAEELTVAAFNFQRFFDTVNDPGIGEPVLTAHGVQQPPRQDLAGDARLSAPARHRRRDRGREPHHAAGGGRPRQRGRARRLGHRSSVPGVPGRGQRRRRHRRRLPGQDGQRGRQRARRGRLGRAGELGRAVRQPRRLDRAAQRPPAAACSRRS